MFRRFSKFTAIKTGVRGYLYEPGYSKKYLRHTEEEEAVAAAERRAQTVCEDEEPEPARALLN